MTKMQGISEGKKVKLRRLKEVKEIEISEIEGRK